MRSHDGPKEASGFSMAFNALWNLLCWFLIDPRQGVGVGAKLWLTFLHASIQYCTVFFRCFAFAYNSSGNRYQKWREREKEIQTILSQKSQTRCPFSNRAPSQWSGGKVDAFFVGDCLYNFLQLWALESYIALTPASVYCHKMDPTSE